MIKYLFLISLLLFSLVISPVTHAEKIFWDKKPHPAGAYGYDEILPDLLNIKGLPYHEARPIIMGAGWDILQTLYEGTEDHEINAMSGFGKIVWVKGYYELQSCTGIGMAYCVFLYKNKNGDQLRVVTKGEQWDEFSSSAEVVGYRFNP